MFSDALAGRIALESRLVALSGEAFLFALLLQRCLRVVPVKKKSFRGFFFSSIQLRNGKQGLP